MKKTESISIEGKGNYKKLKPMLSVAQVVGKRFRSMNFTGVWRDSFGCPELSGTWIIFGDVKQGKTSTAMLLARYLTNFGRVVYNSVEEGVSLSIRKQLQRTFGDFPKTKPGEKHKFGLLDRESVDDLARRFQKPNSADIVIIDSLQFWELSFRDYKRLKEAFPQKLFIYVSHGDLSPDGKVAVKVWRDANIAIRVEGFRLFPTGRYGGGAAMDVNAELSKAYWGTKNN
jgi:hypothetical protein